jgi:adenylate kinase
MVLFVDERSPSPASSSAAGGPPCTTRRWRRTGIGDLLEDRATDHDEALARRRYRVFKEQTWDALQSLKEIFHYHFINAQGSIEEVEQNILNELEYQSTLELDPRTHDRLRCIPVASEIIVHARQELVKRLDSYELEHSELFEKVTTFIEKKIMPIVLRHAISGVALINTEEAVLDDATRPRHADRRVFRARLPRRRRHAPHRGAGKGGPHDRRDSCRVKKVYRIQIRFHGSEIRRG